MARGLLALLFILSGCFNPDDIFPMKGRVASIEPSQGQYVELLRDPDVTGGTASCDGARPFKTTTTDAEGNFQFALFRAQTQHLSGRGTFCFRVQTTFPSGARAWTDITGINGEITTATLREWRTGLFADGGVLQFSPPLPLADAEDAGFHISHRAQFEQADGGLVWQVDDDFSSFANHTSDRRPMEFDSLRVEDFSGTLQLTAVVFEPAPPSDLGPFGNDGYWPVWLAAAATLPVTGGPGPLSRGLPCADLGSPCPLTDGSLESIDLAGRLSLSLQLPGATSVSAVVLRALEAPSLRIDVELFDADGGQVQAVQEQLPLGWIDQLFFTTPSRPPVDGGFIDVLAPPVTWAVIHLDAGVPVKTVTLRFPLGVERCAEISLY